MSISIEVSSSDWVDMRTRGFSGTMYLLNAVGAPLEYSTAASPAGGTFLTGASAALISGTYLWVRGAGTAELFTPAEWAEYNTKTYPVSATPSELGTELYAGGEVLALPGGVQVPSDWNAVAGVARILNKPTVLDAEAVQDLVAAMFAGSHTNLTATYNDATGTLTLSAAGGGGTTAEEVQDFLNTSLAHANHSGVTVTYDDANNRFVIAAVGGSGESVLYRKINVTANAQTVTTIISGFGTSAALNAITVTPTVDGTSSLVLTLGNLGTFKLHSVAANVPAGANAGTGFTVVAPDPAGATTLADSALASMVIYNDPGATVASTLVTVAINAGNLSVQKTGLTAGTAYRFKVLF